MAGLAKMLNMTQGQYQSTVLAFAQDLSKLRELYGETPEKWIQAGLVKNEEVLEEFFNSVDGVLEGEWKWTLEDAYEAHGSFLNFLQSVEEEEEEENSPVIFS